jgi:predicted esterase
MRREGRIGASWYAYDGDQDRFRAELLRTEAIVLGLLDGVESEQGLRPRARVLMGFSQGGYCGSWIALRHPDRFSGLIVSGARVKTEFLRDEIRAAAASGFRALLLHGRRDASVLPEAAERSRAELAAGGVETESRSFDAGHSLGREQVAAMADWLEARFG